MKTATLALALLPLALVAGDFPATTPRFRQITIPTGRGARWISVADLNHDRNPDIVGQPTPAGAIKRKRNLDSLSFASSKAFLLSEENR